jgi:hypothetical protein
MPKFTVKIRDTEVDAKTARAAALDAAHVIALMGTISLFIVTDEHGQDHNINLTQEELDDVLKRAAELRFKAQI